MKRKILLFTYFCVISLSGYAELSVTLNVETPGTLSTMIASSKVSEVTHLTLSGSINSSDVTFIRKMAGAKDKGILYSGCSLEYLDIANVTIIESPEYLNYAVQHYRYRGEDRYSDNHKYSTKNNIITPYMFDNCWKLKTLILPKNVTKIEAEAFYETSISSITLPDDLEILDCDIPSWSITELKISETNHNFKIVDGVLYSYDMKTLYRCPVNYKNTIFQIPEGVENIFNSAFNYCQNIKEIITPSTLKTFGSKALGWLSLDKLVLDPKVSYSSIGDFTNIQEVIIPETYTEFNPSLFGYTSYDTPEWGSTKVNNVKVYSKTPPQLKENFNSATLAGNLFVPKGSYSAYYIAYRWGDFSHIYEMDDEGTEKRCAKPTIYYSNGRVTFNCETNGVKFWSKIVDSDISSYNSNELQLTVTYNISVYATKDGLENSETATATLCWIDVAPKTEGITDGITQMAARAVMIKAEGGQLTIEGAEENTNISVYSLDGIHLGTTASRNGVASINTSVSKDSVAIVKIGNKSVKVIMK